MLAVEVVPVLVLVLVPVPVATMVAWTVWTARMTGGSVTLMMSRSTACCGVSIGTTSVQVGGFVPRACVGWCAMSSRTATWCVCVGWECMCVVCGLVWCI